VTAGRGPIVVDTDVFSGDLTGTVLIDLYEPIIVGRPAFVSFQTVAEVRYGALRRGWGEARLRKFDAKISVVEVVHSGDDLVATYARLRAAVDPVAWTPDSGERPGGRSPRWAAHRSTRRSSGVKQSSWSVRRIAA
jgi:hypothetical protein